ncbi:MAG TPA: sodium:solute symporter family protein [Gemmatimonadaceae bacterium]|nr:sodium:solute symporter family protein [Gemmatimonadaceae bacterium]
MTATAAALLLYLLAQFGLGVWISRRIKSESDYFVAGRSLGYSLATFSIFATWFGAETVVGSAGSAYREGVSVASAEPFGYGICLILMGLVFAAPLWRRQLTTLADLYRQRYSPGVERLAAVILIPSSVLWAAAQIRAFGHVLSTATTGLSAEAAIGLAAGFTILYTMFGGLLVDAITDLFQGILLALGLAVVFVAVIVHFGGPGEAFAAIGRTAPVRLLPSSGGSVLDVVEAWAIPVFGSVVATEIVGRVIAARSPTVARRSSLLAAALYLSFGLIPLYVGLVGPELVPSLADAEQLVPTVARQLLPTLLYAVFAGGLISAILSTVDSTLLVSSGLLSHNLIVPIFRVTEERRKVLIARAGVFAFGCLAYLLALGADGVFALVEQASAFGSAGALVTVCFALFTRTGGPLAAYATLSLGTLSYVLASAAGASHPFLTSLAVALAAYLGGAVLERARDGLVRRGAEVRSESAAGAHRP